MYSGIYIFKPQNGSIKINDMIFNDLYLIFKTNNLQMLSSLAKEANNLPVWHDTISIKISNETQIELEIWDYKVQNYEFIGHQTLKLSELAKTPSNQTN